MSEALTLWTHATLATMQQDGFGLIENGAMLIDNGIISWVGENTSAVQQKYSSAKQRSANGKLITPGLIDCHTHLVYGDNRAHEWSERLMGKTYEQLAKEKKGIYSTVAATRTLSEEQLLKQSLKRAKAALQHGVTTLEIKSGYGLDLLTEQKILTVAKKIQTLLPLDIQTTFLGAHVLPLEYSNKQDYINYLIEEVLPILLRENLIDAIDGFCDPLAFSETDLEPLFLAAKQYHLKLKIHAEQLCPGKGAEFIAKYNGLSADHLEYADEIGIQALKQAGTTAVLLPGAHYFLQQQKIPPISLFRHYNVPMAIATDCNPGTSPTTSLLLMMNMACVKFGLTPLEALQGVTLHAAKALGLNNKLGQLKEGMQADCVIWEATHPIDLSYYFGTPLCSHVIKKGQIVYEA